MIAYIVLSIILMAFVWLLQETDFLLVRLPVGAEPVNKTTITLVEKKLDEYVKLYEAEKPIEGNQAAELVGVE